MSVLMGVSSGIHYQPTKGIPFCEPCCKAKLSEKPFFGHGERAYKGLQIVFADVWGPMEPTPEGFRYALLLVDDFTSYTWVYLMRAKGEAESHIVHFNEAQERRGNMIAELRTDRGGEFSSNIFRSYLKDRGIVLRQSPSHTPQFQGKVERMNRTIGEMAHAMRSAADMSLCFWGLAWEMAVYVRNRCPTRANPNNITPYQRWFGVEPDLSHLRVFGAKGEALVSACARYKGEDHSITGRVVGYDEGSKSYKFLPKKSMKVVLSRTVKCDEESIVGRDRAV
jgi:hypothetical protein